MRAIMLSPLSRSSLSSPALWVALVVALVNLGLWAAMNRPVAPPDWEQAVKGVSFSPYREGQDPYAEVYPSETEIAEDLARLRGLAGEVRTYSSTNGLERVARLASTYGLRVTAGAWLDRREANNIVEVWNLIQTAQNYGNVSRVIVGNESVLRGDVDVETLKGYLDAVRARVDVPVSTAEPWHVWIRHPELADSVDFIAVHLLPYWEQVPFEQALPWVLERYRQVQAAHPGKPVLIAEVGWPSDGARFGPAKPSLAHSAQFIRGFLQLAEREGIDYFLMEAFDQTWKKGEEGSVGPHWGLFLSDRAPKFPLRGEVLDDPAWTLKAVAASLAAFLPVWLFARARPDIRLRGRVLFASLLQSLAAGAVWAASVPATEALTPAQSVLWLLLLPAQALLVLVVLVNGFELVELLWQRGLRRHFEPFAASPAGKRPKVSLHLAIHDEPPELVAETLEGLARLDYPDFEVLVVDNNTRDPALWRPVERQCERLGARFRFFHLANWPGYKAGALNFALAQTAPDAEIIGVVDSDYVVEPNWLKALVPHFQREKVGFVQAPQDHRGWEQSAFRSCCNWEYSGFFHIGMVSRNERDAIIQHGTMTLIRREALRALGGWSEWCICEDAELGLRLLAEGYESVYVNEVFGRGLTPETFTAYRNQRFRWVYGAVQILRRHGRALLGLAPSRLTPAQRAHFLSGWLPWFADAMHLPFTLAAAAWSVGMTLSPRHFEVPLLVFLVPTLAAFGLKLLHALALYRARVPCGWRERLGATLAGMALTHVIALAVFSGLTTRGRPFLRTPKVESRAPLLRGLAMAREEAGLALVLWLSLALVARSHGLQAPEVVLWLCVLAIHSLPYLAAVALAFLNGLPARAARTEPAGIRLARPEPTPVVVSEQA